MVRSFLLALAFILFSFSSLAKVNIFACEPEWKSLSDEIGRNLVKSYSATTAFQDAHYIRAKPSLIAKVRRADLLICSGADLEVGWLPILLTKSGKNVQPGNIGNLMAADFVPRIEVPDVLDRSMGDVHAQGNPHIHLNPHNILLVADELKNRLQKIDPENSTSYQKNYDDFTVRWKSAIKRWELKASPLKEVKFFVHHRSFSYLVDWLKLNQVATLEEKPGIAPNPSHLQSLLQISKDNQIDFIIRAPFDSPSASNWIADKRQIKELVLPFTIGGNKESYDLFSLYENTIDLMLKSQ